VLFVAIRMGAKGSPSTMNKEYQEATNEYLKVWIYPLFTYIAYLSFWVENLAGWESARATRMCGIGRDRTVGGREQQSWGEHVLMRISAEPKLRPHLRYLIRRLQRQRNGPKRTEEELISHSSLVFLALFTESIDFFCSRRLEGVVGLCI